MRRGRWMAMEGSIGDFFCGNRDFLTIKLYIRPLVIFPCTVKTERETFLNNNNNNNFLPPNS